MLKSMTGFANRAVKKNGLHISCDIRSINSRYLDLTLRIPEEWRHLEPDIRNILRERVPRGKVECRIGFERLAPGRGGEIALDGKVVKELARINRKLLDEHIELDPLRVKDILCHPGAIVQNAGDPAKTDKIVLKLVNKTVNRLTKVKTQEGLRLESDILDKLSQIDDIARELQDVSPGIFEAHTRKLKARVRDLAGDLDEKKFAQDLAVILQKYDIDEELVRLRSHVKECRATIEEDTVEGKGKKLDFYMQEFVREANTLGSKAIDERYTYASVNLKVIIERMREQLQNIE